MVNVNSIIESNDTRRHQETPGDTRRHHGTPGDTRRHQETQGDTMGHKFKRRRTRDVFVSHWWDSNMQEVAEYNSRLISVQ